MTPLIDLNLIRVLYDETRHNKRAATRQSLNYPLTQQEQEESVKPISDPVYIHLIKTHAQAKVIFKNLRRIHKVSFDFAAGNFQPYYDRQLKYEEDPEQRTLYNPIDALAIDYNPFSELDTPFNQAFDFPLPRRIEQFTELLGLCKNFHKVRTLKQEGLNPFFGDEPYWFEYTDENGESAILPPDALPTEFVDSQKELSRKLNVAVESALDSYDEFYFLVRDYLKPYARGKDLIPLGAKILALYQ